MSRLPQQELTALNVELGELTPAVEAYNALQRLLNEAKELDGLMSGEDEDMRKLAREEQQALEEQVIAWSLWWQPCGNDLGWHAFEWHAEYWKLWDHCLSWPGLAGPGARPFMHAFLHNSSPLSARFHGGNHAAH